jgi:hypothetical protein
MKQLAFWPEAPPPNHGRLALRDEGGKLVHVDLYTEDGSMTLGIDVPRERLVLYAKWLLEAGLR